MHGLLARARRVRTLVLSLWDLTAWVVGFGSMAALQVAVGYSHAGVVPSSVVAGLLAGTLYDVLGLGIRLHQGRAVLGSFADALLVTATWGLVSAVLLVGNGLAGSPLRVSLVVIGPAVAYALLMGARVCYRLVSEWTDHRHNAPRGPREPVVVIGAGIGATQLLASMARDPHCPWRPVALVDDDPMKRHRRLSGVPVVGRAVDFVSVADSLGVGTVIMAVPSASSEMVRRFNRQAVVGRLDLKVVPTAAALTNPAQVQIQDVRDIEVTDFLGRTPIETDVASIAGYLTGKRVLVTGAGGSIGSELCRQIVGYGLADLVMLDRDESALHAVQLSMSGRALLDDDETALVDLRDGRRVREVFARRRPEVVFHAAALKHLPLLEASPGEAVKTNVWGTQTVISAALEVGVSRFVNISTDKAANPISVLGYSKRLAEGLTAGAAAGHPDRAFLSVRFGNVLASRGSVLETFTSQIAHGLPITVTDPRVSRYFMTVTEAVQLVIQAGAIGETGEVLVLDMGRPVAIQEVAEQLIELSGRAVDIVYTGLRPGEKLEEECFADGEIDRRPQHPMISHVRVPSYRAEEAWALDPYRPDPLVVDDLRVAVQRMSSLVSG